MRWQSGRRSTNVEDGRGASPGGGPRIGGRGIAVGGGGAIVIALLALFLSGGDPQVVNDVLNQLPVDSAPAPSDAPPLDGAAPGDEAADFTSVVLASTEDAWTALFTQSGLQYEPPKLRLFSDAVPSACGYESSAVGPFYCPADRKVYLDLAFFRELHERFGAPGDFAQAYVVAHEIGHHVQTLLDLPRRAGSVQRNEGRSTANEISVRQELQADCFAGVWAYYANAKAQMLEPGDVEEGLRAAAAIGDDRIQGQGRGYVSPESFTHGSSEQRSRWFRRGFEAGDADQCDTYSVAAP
jgi:predicted metalloprotease